MRRAGVVLGLCLAACSNESAFVRLDSDVPRGAAVTRGRPIEGSACNYWNWPFAFSEDRLGRAHEELVRQARGDLIVDVEVQSSSYDLLHPLTLPLGSVQCTELRARAVRVVAATSPGASGTAAAIGPATPALAAGRQARIAAGGSVRSRATLAGEPLQGLGAGDAVTLKSVVRNASGTWWFVAGPLGSGWARESDLQPVAP